MKFHFETEARKEMAFWQKYDPAIIKKIEMLLNNILEDPFKGLGKPEPLKGNYSGCWSRRITQEHRLIYKVEGEDETMVITILQCRYHYND